MKVQIVIPDQFKKELEDAAQALGVTNAMWIRIAVLNALSASKPAASDKPITDAQKKKDQWAEWDARFGKGKIVDGHYLGTEGFNAYMDARRAIRKPDSDADPFKGYEDEDALRRVISYWIELGGEYAHAKRLYGEALMKLPRVDKAARLKLFDELWADEED